MSLINEVLRDLEAKRPDDLVRQNLQREIRSLPPVKARRRLTPLLLLLALAGAGAAWLQGDGLRQLLLGPTPENLAPALPPPAPLVVAAPASDAVLAADAEKLRLAFELSVPPLAPPEARVDLANPPLPPALPVTPSVVPPAKGETGLATGGPVKVEKSTVLATPHDRAEAEYRKAEGALASGNVTEAIDALNAALRHEAAFVAPRQALVGQLLIQRRLAEAAKLLEEGLLLQPGQTSWAMSLARVQLEIGDVLKADETLARFQNQAMHLAEYAGFQGHLKSRQGAHAEAVVHYSRAVRMAPGEGRWWLGLGLALQADGKAGDAKEAFRRALASSTLSAELASIAQQQIQN